VKPALSAIPAVLLSCAAGAHSASDAYLTLTVDERGTKHRITLHGQWDIALRDLDFLLKLDDDGDGQITWGEVKRHQAQIERYAYAQLRLANASGVVCSVTPVRQLIDSHADGAYAVLEFDAVCAPATASLTMNYSLFFAIDPSHRGIFVLHAGDKASVAVLSPQNPKIVLAVDPP
jgi:hypothetical protein